MNPKKARDTRLITAAVDDLMGDVSVVSERVFDLGISQQLAADMEGYGINDSILEWIEERFSDGTAQNTNEDTGGP